MAVPAEVLPKSSDFPSILEQQYNSYLALEDKTTAEAIAIIKDGYKKSNQCFSAYKDNLECRYFLGLFRGEMLALKQVSIKSELNLMVSDFESVIQHQADYDRAGAHRALGHLYLELPSLPILGFALKKDLPKAWEHVAQSLKSFPEDAENLYLAGLIRIAEDDKVSAGLYFNKAADFMSDYTGPKAEKLRLRAAIQKGIKQAQK